MVAAAQCSPSQASLPTDRQLVRSVAQGDLDAFDELYRRYHRPLFTYIARLTGNAPVAEEVLQEVFVAVWQGAGRFRGDAKVSTWMFRIAHHQTVNWLRKRRPVLGEDAMSLAVDDRAGGTPEEQALAGWEHERLHSALDRLTPEHRAVIELAFFHGLPYQEIARIVDCPPGTVKSRMSHAKRQLAGWLCQEGITKAGREEG